jgi:hypothetical protein
MDDHRAHRKLARWLPWLVAIGLLSAYVAANANPWILLVVLAPPIWIITLIAAILLMIFLLWEKQHRK